MPANYVLIGEYTTNATVSSITFANIPQTYTDLRIVWSARGNLSGAWLDVTAKFESSTTGYSQRYLFATGSSASQGTGGYSAAYAGHASGTSNPANTFSNVEMFIPNYRSSVSKTFNFNSVTANNSTSALTMMGSSVWTGTAAITNIVFEIPGGSFIADTSFSIYGVAQFGVTPTVLPKATGGDIIVNDGTYWYHAFLSSGIFIPNQTVNCDALVIGGGGGGGGGYGNQGQGGGGAGGIFYGTNKSFTSGNYVVTIGAGGNGGPYDTGGAILTPGFNGVDSSITSLTSAIGGGGGAANSAAGNGGSGGGGMNFGGVGGTSTQTSTGGTGYGNAGGNGGGGTNQFGGSGGGSGSAGTFGGSGGAGLNTWSSWATTTATGVSGFYAGGGGTSYISGTTAGGSGGGGAGSNTFGGAGGSGVVNTGSGGGGAYGGNVGGFINRGGNGGSGLVIIRYPIVQEI